MATINYPLTKTILSAEGTAEVLGYGSNDYTANWSDPTDLTAASGWSLWDSFPTVVRVGNFVWCWYSFDNNHTNYVLIDVVEDVEKELGSNIAYPEITNDQSPTVANVMDGDASPISWSTIDEGPYRPLAVTTDTSFESADDGHLSSWNGANNLDNLVPIFYNGTINEILLGCTNSSFPTARGWGDDCTLKGTAGTYSDTIGLFAPFLTKTQFDILYGSETDWITATTGSYLFYDDQSSPGPHYPNGDGLRTDYIMTVEEMVPNDLYREVLGDNTGNGEVDEVSLSGKSSNNGIIIGAAVAGAAVALSKCGVPGLPDLGGIIGKISDAVKGIAGLPGELAKAGKDALKKEIESAASSTGLSKIVEKAEGVKAQLEANLPKIPEFPNMMLALASLDLNDVEAVEAFKKKWGPIYGDVQGLIDKYKNKEFDVCELVGVNAKEKPDGSLAKIPEEPVIPSEESKPAEVTSIEKVDGLDTPYPNPQFLETRRNAIDAKNKFNAAWFNMLNGSEYKSISSSILDAYETAKEEWPRYSSAGADDDIDEIFAKSEIYNKMWAGRTLEREVARVRQIIYNKFRNETDNTSLVGRYPWAPALNIKVGDVLAFDEELGGSFRPMLRKPYYDDVAMWSIAFSDLVTKTILTEDFIKEMEPLALADPSDNTKIGNVSAKSSKGITIYGLPITDLTTFFELKDGDKKKIPGLLPYWVKRFAKQNTTWPEAQASYAKKTGNNVNILPAAYVTKGAYGGDLIPYYSASSTRYPGGTIIKLTNSDGTIYDPAGKNPKGLWRIDDTGKADLTYKKVDLFLGGDIDVYNTYKKSNKDDVTVTVITLGTRKAPQYLNAQDLVKKGKLK